MFIMHLPNPRTIKQKPNKYKYINYMTKITCIQFDSNRLKKNKPHTIFFRIQLDNT